MGAVTVQELLGRKGRGPRISMLTAYDYPMGRLVDAAGVDAVLVGDSLGMVVLGYETTAPVTMDEMLHHAKAARRGVLRALLVGDMPLQALRGSVEDGVRHARRFTQEAGCEAVKLEWREGIAAMAKAIVGAGIPVIGHVGLTPQTAAAEGGYGTRGKDAAAAARIVAQARALEQAGCFALVLECVPDLLAQELTRRLRVPTIGIGSGPWCDGQVLVTYDLVGLFERFRPRFVRRYAQVGQTVQEAAAAFVRDVRSGQFPGAAETVSMAPEEFAKLRGALDA
jgi:3-methyl-2-oxobutanoate hydroxymethyltransferase